MSPKILFIDIETSPNVAYVWGLFDQNISIDQIVSNGYILCASYKWRGSKKVEYVKVQGNERSALKQLHKVLDEADFVVHYNGTKFDIPTMHREFLLKGMPPPSPVKQIDLLRTVRRQFRFSSNKLDHVCQRLGLGNKVHHKGMALWKGCIAGEESSWEVMERYNKQDVVLLEKLYDKVLPWIVNHPNVTLYTGVGCPKCGSKKFQKRGLQNVSTRTYQRYQCSSCHGWFRSVKGSGGVEYAGV